MEEEETTTNLLLVEDIRPDKIKPNNNYFPNSRLYQIYPNDIPLKNFVWRHNLCYCYSTLQYIVRIPEINNFILKNTKIEFKQGGDNLININCGSFNETIDINKFISNLPLKLLSNDNYITDIDNIYTRFFRSECGSNFDMIDIDAYDNAEKDPNYKFDQSYILYDIFTGHLIDKTTLAFRNYKKYYLLSLYIIFIYLTLENPFENNIFKTIYCKYYGLPKTTIITSNSYSTEMQNFLHIFIYIISYHYDTNSILFSLGFPPPGGRIQHINYGSSDQVMKNISAIFNKNIDSRNGYLLSYEHQLCYILISDMHYINIVKHKEGPDNYNWYYIESLKRGCSGEGSNGITLINRDYAINLIKKSENTLSSERSTDETIFRYPCNRLTYYITTGGSKNISINQKYKYYLNKYNYI